MLSHMIRRNTIHRAENLVLAASALIGLAAWPSAHAQTRKPAPPKSVRMYVLDCGKITVENGDRMGFKPGELATANMVTPCFLIVHPRGTMMWDTGEIPDSAFKSGVTPQTAGAFTVDRPLLPQLAALGYTPADITYLALSHYHGDHVANASLFARSTWIVQKGDRDAIFAPRVDMKGKLGGVGDLAYFAGLDKSKTLLLKGEDHDVFGDGTVVIKFTPGHTPGHQSLLVKLPKTGALVLSGDAAHFQSNWENRRVPSLNTSAEQTRASMQRIADILAKEKATLWINHDKAQRDTLSLAPAYYE